MSETDTKHPNEWIDGAKLADAIDKRLFTFFQDAKLRNEERLTSVLKEIEKTLRVIMAKPFVASDLHCQNLITRIARANDPEIFMQRVIEFDNYIKKLVAETLGEEQSEHANANNVTQLASNTKAQVPETPVHLVDEDDITAARMRLQLK